MRTSRCTDFECQCPCHLDETAEDQATADVERSKGPPRSGDAEIEGKARARLKLMYGMTNIHQDPNGTWWIGSDRRPDLLNMETLAAAAQYLDSLPDAMLDSLSRPRGSDSEQHSQHLQQEQHHG